MGDFRRRQAFTLIELMVSVSIVVIIVGAIFASVNAGQRSWSVGDAKVAVTSQARRALSEIIRELSQAGSATVAIVAAQNSITFQTPSGFAGGVVTWNGSVTYALGGLGGTQLIRTDNSSGESRVVANDITAVLFRQVGTKTVDVQLTMQHQALSGESIVLPVGTRIYMRN